MTPIEPTHSADAEGPAYLDGRAGRRAGAAADPEAYAEGARLRAALLAHGAVGDTASAPPPLPPPPPDGWADVLARASAGPGAANAPGFWSAAWTRRPRRAGLAAAAVLLAAVGLWQARPTDDEAWRGASEVAAATWFSAQPQADAQALVAELQAMAASARASPLPAGGMLVDLHMPAAATAAQRDAVNARLAALDTALDAQGRCQVRVLPAAGTASAAGR